MKLSRKNLGRVATTFLATAMLASLTAVPAFATEEPATTPKTVTITKNVLKDKDAYAPATTFNFKVKPWTGDYETGALIQPGPVNGVYFTGTDGQKTDTGSIASAPKADDVDGVGDDTVAVVGNTTLTIDETLMLQQAPGIYRYEVTEENGTYDGMTYSQETKYLDVYVTIENGEKSVSSYTFVDKDDTKVKDNGIFENKYNETEGANRELKVEKVIAGSQASPSQEFDFNITINGAPNEQYKIVKTNASDSTEAIPNVDYLVSGQQATFTLQGGEYITVYGLSPNDTYTVAEADYTKLGYTTEVKVDDTVQDPTNKTISGEEDTVTVTNTRDASAPTGIAMDIAPYALLVVIAAAGCFVFLRKRNED